MTLYLGGKWRAFDDLDALGRWVHLVKLGNATRSMFGLLWEID